MDDEKRLEFIDRGMEISIGLESYENVNGVTMDSLMLGALCLIADILFELCDCKKGHEDGR